MSRKQFIVRGGGNFSGLYNEFNKAQKKMNVFQKGMSGALKTVTGLFGGLAAGSLAKDFAKTALRTETLEIAMNAVARASGYATDELNDAKDAIREKGIAEQESMQILTRLMQSQLDVADAADLARVAQDAGVIANMDSSQAAEQMTEAIAKQRPELLSAFGMTKNLNVILSEYAETLGRSANELGEAERKQAMLNYIMSEGQKIAGTYEASMDAVGKKIGSMARHWQDLQNAIAKPLMIPGIGVAVDAITNALQRATAWAEANSMTLAYWGQVVANAVGTAVNVFQWLGRTLADNWFWIRNVITAFASYQFAVFATAKVSALFQTVMTVLKGEMVSSAGVMGFLSQAIGIYRVQMALAPATTNIFTGALLRLRTALYAVHTALGPIGWAIIALSGALAGGTMLWNKYTGSINKANQAKVNTGSAASSAKNAIASQNETLSSANKALNDMNKNAGKAGSSQKKLADGIKKADKAAKGSLAGFDEINTLQQDMGDTDASGLGDIGSGGVGDVGGAGGVPEIDIPDFGGIGGMGDLGIGDALGSLEMAKPSLSGFWQWLTDGFWNAVEIAKGYWNNFVEWFKSTKLGEALGNVWEGVQEKWESFTTWASGMWEGVKGAWDTFTFWVGPIFSSLWEGVKSSWKSFTTWASNMWKGTKAVWNTFTEWVSDIFSNIWNSIKNAWNGFTSWASNMWEGTKNNWNNFKESTLETFGTMWKGIKNTFSNTREWFENTFGGAWESIKNIFSFSNIQNHFNTALDTIKGVFKSIPNWFGSIFTTAWTNVKNVFSTGGKIFSGIKDGIASTFKTVVNGLINGINRIIKVPFNAINGMLNKIRNVSILGAKPFSGFISQNAIRTPQIPRLAKGGITNGEMLAVVGDNPGGREVVSPLDTLQSMLVEAVGTAMTQNEGSSGGQEVNANITIQVGEEKLARTVIKGINNYQDRMGQTLLNV